MARVLPSRRLSAPEVLASSGTREWKELSKDLQRDVAMDLFRQVEKGGRDCADKTALYNALVHGSVSALYGRNIELPKCMFARDCIFLPFTAGFDARDVFWVESSSMFLPASHSSCLILLPYTLFYLYVYISIRTTNNTLRYPCLADVVCVATKLPPFSGRLVAHHFQYSGREYAQVATARINAEWVHNILSSIDREEAQVLMHCC
jgi:hypothetical protein